MQTLFMDHVSSRLSTLELNELKLEDLQFKHSWTLAKCAIPKSPAFELGQNASFSETRSDRRVQYVTSFIFSHPIELRSWILFPVDTEMTNQDLQRFIACLSTTPALQSLTVSHNLCSFATIQKLRELIESRA
ncbi:hypothetical protein GQ600_12899 [Phytophthora cactorum]|nr:hypothetical protein GQ600_12899 [Phytophthora cactorum]